MVDETDSGIIVRGAKFETAAAYANQAFVKPTIGDWGDAQLSDYAVGFIADMGAPGVKHICRSTFGGRESSRDYPLSNRFDEIDTMIVFDDVEIPWENVLFYRHTKAAAFIRATLHRYSIFPFVQRHLRFADLLLGVAYTNAVQTGREDAPGGAREARRARRVPRGHQRAPDRRHRAGASPAPAACSCPTRRCSTPAASSPAHSCRR